MVVKRKPNYKYLYMNSENLVTVIKSGSQLMGKIGEVFKRFEDGRVHARFDLTENYSVNIALKPGEFLFNEDHLPNLENAILEAIGS